MKKVYYLILFAWLVFFQLSGTGFARIPTPFLSLSDEMKHFLDEHVMRADSPKERLRILIKSIFNRSLLDFKYSDSSTYTAEETFKHRTGNCLYYTAMFIVMARYAGLSAHFQEVNDYSNWTKRENTVVFNRHINASVQVAGRRIEVDFNFSTDKKLRRTRIVGDQRAQAHYYNNIGAEALMVKNYARAESLFKKAINLGQGFSPPWTNLGLLYQYTGKPELAERSYKKAISLDKRDFTAQLNLSKLYKLQGNRKKAEEVKKRIEKYLRKNPFYHYSLGQRAFKEGKFRLAVQHYRRAIKRDSREQEFYVKLAAAYFELRSYKAAEKYLKKAGKLAVSSRDRIRFNKKLNYLYSHSHLKR